MKKLKFILGIILLCATVAFSQSSSLTIATLPTANVNDTVDVSINAANLSNIGAISLKVSYDATVLQYLGVENAAVAFTNNATNGVVSLGWFDASNPAAPLNISAGKLVDLKFVVKSTVVSSLDFVTNDCSIADENGSTVALQLNNGGVNSTPSGSITIASVNAPVGDTVSVPLTAKGISNIGAISLKISYNSSNLSFVDVKNAAVTFTYNAASGVISLGWFDATATTPMKIDSGKLVDLRFVVNSSSADNLSFLTSQSELSDESGKVVDIQFVNGIVNSGTVSNTYIQIEKVIAAPGKGAKVGVKVLSFNNVGAISLKISYNATALTFDSLTGAPSGVTFTHNAAGGVISIGWFDATGNSPISLDSTNLFALNFTYNGGQGSLNFEKTQCDISDNLGNSIQGINYVDGSVLPQAGTAPTFEINSVPASPGKSVMVPVIGKKLQHIGAISLKINYDPSVLSFQSASNAVVTGMTTDASGGVVSISWFDQTGTHPLNIDSASIVDLNFNFVQDSTSLTFLGDKSEIADSLGQVLQTVVYLNGKVYTMVTAVKKVPGLPTKYNLNQNYPNPFNPTTKIDFSIPKESQVVLKIYNAIGQEVSTLVNGELHAGNYSFNFNAVNLPSGIYLYRLNAGEYTATKKMILSK